MRAKTKPARAVTQVEPTDRRVYGVIAGVVAWTFAYFLIFEPLGFMIATSIYLFGLMAYFNRGKWLTNLLTAVGFCVGSYFLFKVLGVSLARGILPF